MKKLIIVLICLFLPFSLFAAETPRLEQKRRVEEGKRESLRASETHPESYPGEVSEEKLPPPAKTLDRVDVQYLAELSMRNITYGYDACKTVVLLLGVENDYLDLNSQVAFLIDQGYLPKKYKDNFNPKEPLRRGLASYMFYKILDIKGGVILRIIGPTQRYAMKELAHEGILAEGNVGDILSGGELISILTQSANYLADKKK